ncbi:NOL1/NOP2/sun family putative RNA methylase [Candidatus Gracilibacteria bacterium]|nr:NOL1/NOP2/sun family putative RNA methylase [Candidatus Gracilibacteria bacterium]
MKQDFHPDFIKRYEPLFSKDEFSSFLEYCIKPLRKSIRVNTLRISLKDFEKRAIKNNWVLEQIPYVENGYFITWDHKNEALGKSIEYFAGLFYIQETSSMIPPIVLDPQEGEVILDVSAAPGSKSTQLSTMIDNNGLIMANDIVPSRIKALKTNVNYLGMISIATSKLDGRDFGRYYNETFDKILLDAPCSGEGTMRKDKINWSMSVIEELATLQKRLIGSALQALKIGGELVYSTCTMTPEEDELILDYAKKEFGESIEIIPWKLDGLESRPGLTQWEGIQLDKECQYGQKIWPHINNTEGFFIAKIKKTGEVNVDKVSTYYPKKLSEKIIKGKELKVLYSQIKKRFNIDKQAFAKYIIVKKGNEIEIRTKDSNSVAALPNIQSIGIPFGEEKEGKFNLGFYSAQVFGKYADLNLIDLNREQVDIFKNGVDLVLKDEQIKNCLLGQVIITYDNIIIGTSLLQKNNNLKNQVPRETIKL